MDRETMRATCWATLVAASMALGGCADDATGSAGTGGNCTQISLPCDCPGAAPSTTACGVNGALYCQCGLPTGGSGGSAGFAGSGGTGPMGGSGGTGGVAGAGATGGVGGSAGSSGTGGVSGTGGSGAVGATGGSGGAAGTGGGGTGGSGGSNCLQGAGGDYTAMGPYAVTQTDVTLAGSLGTYTIFRPTNLDANCAHPMIAWGNGTGVTGSNVYGFYQTHAASWGMVVIASHSDQAGSMAFLAGGLDYLIAQNQSGSGALAGKLSAKAGTAGHSQGGFAATTATSHPSVVAEVCVQGGGSPPADVAFMCLTGTADFVEPQCTAAYNAAGGPAFLGNYQGADHMTTPTLGGYVQNNPGTKQYQRLYTAWFRCHLAGDETACAMFRGGSSCGICGEPNWFRIEAKNF